MHVLVGAQHKGSRDRQSEVEAGFVRPPAEGQGDQRKQKHENGEGNDLAAPWNGLQDVAQRIDRWVGVDELTRVWQMAGHGPRPDRRQVCHHRAEPEARDGN